MFIVDIYCLKYQVDHLGLVFAISVPVMTGRVLALQIISHVDTLHLFT